MVLHRVSELDLVTDSQTPNQSVALLYQQKLGDKPSVNSVRSHTKDNVKPLVVVPPPAWQKEECGTSSGSSPSPFASGMRGPSTRKRGPTNASCH